MNSSTFYRELFDAAPDAMYIHDGDGRILGTNQAASDQTGIPVDRLTGGSIFDIADGADPELTRDRWKRLAREPGEVMLLQSRHRHASGKVFPVEIRVRCLRSGKQAIYVASVRDASERLQWQQALQRRADFEHLLVRMTARLIQSPMKDLDQEITRVLGMMGEFFRVDRAYLFLFSDEGDTMSNTHEWAAPGIEEHAAELQDIPLETFPVLIEKLKADQVFHVPKVSELPEEAHRERAEFEREHIQSILIVSVMRRQRLVGFVGFDAVRSERHWADEMILGLRLIAQTIISVLESRILSTRLTRLAFHDPLTGLPNRKLLQEQIRRSTSGPLPDDRRLALLMLDLDDFKQINDRLGHTAGDALLCEIAERLKSLVREPDLVARLGGDEFVILLTEARPGEARGLAERVLETFRDDVDLESERIRTSPSIGIAEADSRRDDLMKALLHRADMAMYQAKIAGKNCYREYGEESGSR